MRLKLLALILCLALLPTTILAQTITTNNSVVGIHVEYPDDWSSQVVPISETINALYLADSDATMDAILNDPTSFMPPKSMSLIFNPPAVYQNVRTLDQMRTIYADIEWEETTINDRPAYRWDYEDNRTQGFAVLYELSDGSFSFAVADTATGELTDAVNDLLIEIISSVETYSLIDDIDEGLDFSETAIIGDFAFSFQYPENWQISEVEEINNGVILSPDTSSSTLDTFLGSPFFLITQTPLESFGFDDDFVLETGEMSLELIESYAESAGEDGLFFTTVELIEIDGKPVGRVFAEGTPTIFMFVVNEDIIVQIWIISDDNDIKEALESVAEELIASVNTDNAEEASQLTQSINSIRGSASEPEAESLDFPTEIDDLDASYTMENGIIFDYVEGWSVLEDDTGLVLVSNVNPIEDFTAQQGEFLLIISTVTSDVMELTEVIIASMEISSIMSEFPDFDVNIFRIDSSEELSDITFDIGEPAIDWNYSSGLLASPATGVNGAITIIMSQDGYSENLATSIIDPIILTFRTEED